MPSSTSATPSPTPGTSAPTGSRRRSPSRSRPTARPTSARPPAAAATAASSSTSSVHQVRAAVPAAVQVDVGGLQEGRQHGDHRRHRHGRALLPLAGALRQDLEQRAHQLPAPVVPADRLLRLRTGLQELPGQLPVRVRRVRRQRLQRHALRQLQHRPGEHVHAADREHHRRRRGEAGGAGGEGRGGARGAPHRLLPHLPHPLRHLQQRRLRRPRLPQEVQRPLHEPQQPAQGPDRQPPGQVPLRPHHVRRLLLRRLRHGQEPRQLRLQHGVPDVLRRRRRQVQLPEQCAVRDVGRGGVLQPGGAPQLGRHPPHRGRLQADHRRLAQRRLLQPGHPPQLGGDHQDRPNPIKNTLFLSLLLNYLRLRCRRGKGVSIGNGGSMWHNNLYTCSSFLLCCNLSPVFNHK
ncbi:hypothetical protein PVAP13_4NG037408 [Panicum virgatum]|uniref:Uncharacterized protein n=1 Tax=Panicum virgatum TaxID=38727 RepID=A0A8T0T530_PANVG|nr:hypothetical protein PVAP13_4NG037408 [Panicum virgatum]